MTNGLLFQGIDETNTGAGPNSGKGEKVVSVEEKKAQVSKIVIDELGIEKECRRT